MIWRYACEDGGHPLCIEKLDLLGLALIELDAFLPWSMISHIVLLLLKLC